jgi:putative transposase
MRDGNYCYPLTVTDQYSRFLLGCRGLDSTSEVPAQRAFERLFREYGLPDAIRTDNGVPFATTALGRLSRMSVWWIKLGIRPELTQPSHPEQNGRHERMHKTLKAETTRPPAAHKRAQQREFDRFRRRFNEERPHEALEMATPASLYLPSPRPYPPKIDAPATTAFAGTPLG